MPTYLIRHRVQPLPTNPHYAKLGGAFACIFVSHDDQETAEQMAYDWLAGKGFESLELVGMHGPISRDLTTYDPVILALFDRAQIDGIAGDFVGYVGGAEIFN